MTTTDTTMNLPPSPPAASERRLRRATDGRVGAGVAAGLGRYFGLDPVLFRVLFATAAFFGGAGLIAYLLAWAAIPDEGAERAPIDGWVASLRRRRVPVWVVAAGAIVLVWLIAFSWWAPGPFVPMLVIIVVLIVAFGRRDWQGERRTSAPAPGPDVAPGAAPEAPVSLTKEPDPTGTPHWPNEARAWFAESRAARRERRARSLPLRIAVVVTLVLALIVLGTVDAVTGIPVVAYFLATGAIVVSGLLIGAIARRTPWSTTVLLVPAVVGSIALAGSHASLQDGVGERTWRPTTVPASSYRLAFGQGVLDLRALPAQDRPRVVRVTLGAGQVRVLTSATANVRVEANVHFGRIEVTTRDTNDSQSSQTDGASSRQVVDPPAGARGALVTVAVHLADGNLSVRRT